MIQAAFQWGGGHLHEFEAAGVRYGTSDPDYDAPGSVRSDGLLLQQPDDLWIVPLLRLGT